LTKRACVIDPLNKTNITEWNTEHDYQHQNQKVERPTNQRFLGNTEHEYQYQNQHQSTDDEEIRKELVSENGSVKSTPSSMAIHNMGASHP